MPRLLFAPILLLAAVPAAAQTLTVTGGPHDLTHVVVTAPLPAGATATNSVELPGSTFLPAQVTDPPLNSPLKGKVLTFVLPKLAAGESLAVRPGTLAYVKPRRTSGSPTRRASTPTCCSTTSRCCGTSTPRTTRRRRTSTT